jgi:methylmalonyl-CoA carboxyltransferase large subunit
MKSETKDWAQVAETLEALGRELSRLGERVAALEAAASAPAVPVPSAAPAPRPKPAEAQPNDAVATNPKPAGAEGLDEELILVIGAAIAAFLGKKAHVRQIQLIGSAAWAQQGRVTIQASHALSVHTPRSQP